MIRKSKRFLFFCCLLAIGLLFAGTVFADNLLPNPDFEEGTGNTVKDWEFTVPWGRKGFTGVWDDTNSYSGNRSLKIIVAADADSTTVDWRGIDPWIEVKDDQWYDFSCYINADNVSGGSHKAEVQWFGGSSYLGSTIVTAQKAGQWERVGIGEILPPAGADGAIVLLRAMKPGTYNYDLVMFREVEISNIISNHSGEYLSGNKPKSWSQYTSFGSPDFAPDRSVAHTGGNSLRISCASGNDRGSWFTPNLPVKPGVGLSGGFYYKVDPNTPNARPLLGITARDAGGVGTEFYTIPLDYVTEWTFVPLENLQLPAGSVSIYLTAELQGPGTVWYDTFWLLQSEDLIPPYPPTNAEGKRNQQGAVELSWLAPEPARDGDFAANYRIYRSNRPDVQLIPGNLQATVGGDKRSWVDKNAPLTEDLYYRITALDKVGNESEPTSEITLQRMSILSGKVIGKDKDDNVVPFDEIEAVLLGAQGERITLAIDAVGEFSIPLLAGIYSLKIKAPLFRTYSQKNITVVEGEDKELGQVIILLDQTRPNAPRELKVDSSYPGVLVLTWREPEEAEDGEIASSYNIYRGEKESFQRTKENLLHAEFTATELDDKFLVVDFGKTFYYQIEAVDAAGNISLAATEIVGGTVAIPSVPQLLAPKGRELILDEELIFEWEAVPAAVGYELELSYLNPDFVPGKTVSKKVDQGNEYQWAEALKQGRWFWRVRAVFEKEIVSAWSEPYEFVASSLVDNQDLVPYFTLTPNIVLDQGMQISFLLTKPATVSLKVYNLGGECVTSFEDGYMESVTYQRLWDGKDTSGRYLPNGLYFMQLVVRAEGKAKTQVTQKFVLNR